MTSSDLRSGGARRAAADWQVSSLAFAAQRSPTVWQIGDGPAGPDQRCVALVVARPA